MSLIVKSKLQEIIKNASVEGKTRLSTSGTLAGALDKKIEAMILEACSRAVLNGRTTVMDKDV